MEVSEHARRQLQPPRAARLVLMQRRPIGDQQEPLHACAAFAAVVAAVAVAAHVAPIAVAAAASVTG